MNVVVNKAKCLRSGQCMYLHPKIFKEDANGYPEVIAPLPLPAELEAEAEDAADICPAAAIDTEA